MQSSMDSVSRGAVGAAATLLITGVTAYLLFLYALSLGFDGPGALSLGRGVAWLVQAFGTAVLGMGAGAAVARLITRNWAVGLVAALPGAVVSTYLLVMITGLVMRLMQR